MVPVALSGVTLCIMNPCNVVRAFLMVDTICCDIVGAWHSSETFARSFAEISFQNTFAEISFERDSF